MLKTMVLYCDHLGTEVKRFNVIKKDINKAAKQLIHTPLIPPIKHVKQTAGNREMMPQNVTQMQQGQWF
jgi:hypothetical protein